MSIGKEKRSSSLPNPRPVSITDGWHDAILRAEQVVKRVIMGCPASSSMGSHGNWFNIFISIQPGGFLKTIETKIIIIQLWLDEIPVEADEIFGGAGFGEEAVLIQICVPAGTLELVMA
ncbi:hypothetical protein NPIL_382241 [Nephila pilipes]|uniref:Uncharacterized protein n=1 Tax=Nephila pilipes TaxID=299642 RepID=A0A8X6NJ66_NEPPI|nr:hypothetical protein NPIL_382241 [Nephila pilipes]